MLDVRYSHVQGHEKGTNGNPVVRHHEIIACGPGIPAKHGTVCPVEYKDGTHDVIHDWPLWERTSLGLHGVHHGTHEEMVKHLFSTTKRMPSVEVGIIDGTFRVYIESGGAQYVLTMGFPSETPEMTPSTRVEHG